MLGLQNISQLYQKYFDTPGKVSFTNTMADQKDYTNAEISTMRHELRDEPSPSEPLPSPQLSRNIVDPSTCLEEVITSAFGHKTPSRAPAPTHALPPTGLNIRLQALIRASRFPPGQRAMFAAIDALSSELDHQDAFAGLSLSLLLLQGTLENAVEEPTAIEQHPSVRRKLMAEYAALPEKEHVDGVGMDVLIERIKVRLASRWRVEAMEKQ